MNSNFSRNHTNKFDCVGGRSEAFGSKQDSAILHWGHKHSLYIWRTCCYCVRQVWIFFFYSFELYMYCFIIPFNVIFKMTQPNPTYINKKIKKMTKPWSGLDMVWPCECNLLAKLSLFLSFFLLKFPNEVPRRGRQSLCVLWNPILPFSLYKSQSSFSFLLLLLSL